MSWNPLKALLKLGARRMSDDSYNKEEKKVRQSTYAQVGKDIRRAKKNGKRIDAKKEYQSKYHRNMRTVAQKKIRRDRFIDDL